MATWGMCDEVNCVRVSPILCDVCRHLGCICDKLWCVMLLRDTMY